MHYPNNPILVRGKDNIVLVPFQDYRANEPADLVRLWRNYGGGTNSILFPTPLGWCEVREYEDGDGAVLLHHPGDYFLTLVADPFGWWEDALMVDRIAYTEPDATEEAEALFYKALNICKGNPI